MKFSTKIVALQHRPWSQYYLDYNGLKRILAEIDEDSQADSMTREAEVSLVTKTILVKESTTFVFLEALYSQVQNITLFVIKKQGEIADELMIARAEQDLLLKGHILDTTDLVPLKTLRDKYNKLGAKLFHLIQFVDMNVKGIVRILKKHDKRKPPSAPRALDTFIQGNAMAAGISRSAAMMSSLGEEENLDALCVTLETAYTELRQAGSTLNQPELLVVHTQEAEAEALPQPTLKPSKSVHQDLERGRSREAETGGKQRARSPKALVRKHRSVQGLQQLLTASLATSDNGTETTEEESRELIPVPIETKTLNQDDFIMAQIYAARRNLKQHDKAMNMFATKALCFYDEPPEIIMPQKEDGIKAEYERAAALAAYKRASAISGILNFVSSFIYMANYLIVVPTVVTYSQKLGADPALSSAIVGMTPFATIFSTFLYSWWTSYSYRIPLLFAASLNVAGNIIYAMGYPCNSMTLVLVGRLMSGLGSCRPINRRYIADAYSTAERTAASAHFVTVGCFGMALGPFLGSVLHRIAEHSTSPYWQVENAPGWFMAAVWFVYVIFHIIFFVDPPKEDEKEVPAPTKSKIPATIEEKKPLLNHGSTDSMTSMDSSLDERVPLWKNAAVLVNFFIYFIEKLLMECVSSSTSILAYHYFGWPGSWAGYYLAFLCLLVLPVNLLVAYLSRIYEDREMMMVMQAATVVGCLIILQYADEYHIEQYLLGSLIIVVFSNMVEGPNMSLLSKTIPKSWRKGFFNVGLLATEAATLGRTAGDIYLAVCGSQGLEHQLNYTFGSMVLVTSFTLWISYRYYDALSPTEDLTL